MTLANNMMIRGAAWLEGQRRAHMGLAATYVRGDDEIDVTVTAATSGYEQASDAGAIVQAEAPDFLIGTSQLVIDGELITPQGGDRIRVAFSAGGPTREYEVLDLGGTGAARPSGPFGLAWRVHCKLIDDGEEG